MDKTPCHSAKSRRLNSTFSGRTSTPYPKAAKVGSRSFNGEPSFGDLTTHSIAETECEQELECNNLLTALSQCALEESGERENTEVDVMLTQLDERCRQNTQLLDKMHKRLNEISFHTEKQRILEMKEHDCSNVFEQIDTSREEKVLADLTTKQQSGLDQIETKNVDVDCSLQSGYRQLLDTMDDALESYSDMKNQSKMSLENLNEHSTSFGEVKTQKKDLNELKTELRVKFSCLNKQPLIEGSEEDEEEQLDSNESIGKFSD